MLPTSISFPSSVQITTDKDAAPLELTWRRCLSGGCFADGAPKDETIAHWRRATQPGHMIFKDAADRDIAIPLSFRGLAPALDALTKEKG
ncbi:invasion associated locus B family protein [Rhizobium sp. RCAM05973]|uniref:invasion associated locus B family protein n=1 Tax=Rhizobium sp. RCAM05973 TaxID=2994066 RepID=UPI0022EBB614